FSVDATITVVDAMNFDRHLAASEVTREQIAGADFVVLNKTDLVDEARIARVESEIRAINTRAHIVRTQHGSVDADVLFGTAARSHVERLRAQSLHEPVTARALHL